RVWFGSRVRSHRNSIDPGRPMADRAVCPRFTAQKSALGALVLLPILFTLSGGTALAAALSASLDRDTVALGETVTLSLTFDDANPGSTPSLPNIQGVSVAGAGQSRSFTVVNGQATSKLTFNYTLAPTQVGELTIPAMRIRVDGQDMTTS